MVRALQPGGLTGVRGVAAYCAELSAGSDKHGHPIDWELLRREIGAPTNLGGDSLAKLALARILGDESAIAAVRGYVQGDEASELARSVLWCLRPRAAILECERIFRASQDANRRRSAIELLRGMADGSVLAWLGEVFDDPDPGVRYFAVDLLRYLGHAGMTHPELVAPISSAPRQ
jgi:hypothetical protein